MPTIPAVDLQLRPAPVLKDALFSDLIVAQSRKLPGHREFAAEGSDLRFAGSRVEHRLELRGPGWTVLARNETGAAVAAEKSAGRGRVAFIGTYSEDPGLFLWLARRVGLTARYAWCDDPQVEVVPTVNAESAATYLFVINRGSTSRVADIRTLDPKGGGASAFVTEVGGHSVSILKVRDGRLESASLQGGETGTFVASGSQRVVLQRATQADLLREPNGDLLLWADRATQVELENLGEQPEENLRVLTASGEEVAVQRTEGTLRFAYHPGEEPSAPYRLSRGGAP
jgi:hypothetical protein